MEDLEDVRRRMSQKKQQPVLTDHSFNRFYKFAISSMMTIAIVLMGGCFIKTYPNINIAEYLDTHILSLLPSISFIEERQVNQYVYYQEIDLHQYKTNDEKVYALDDGIVVDSSQDYITILYDNGVTAYYKGLASRHIEKYDRISSDELIATYEGYFELILNKDGKEVSYEEFVSSL